MHIATPITVQTKEVLYRIERQTITQSLEIVRRACIAATQRIVRTDCSNTKTAMADFSLFNMLRTVTQHKQYYIGEVLVIPRRICQVENVRTGAFLLPILIYPPRMSDSQWATYSFTIWYGRLIHNQVLNIHL